MSDTNGRRVVANLTVSLDGRYAGPGGPADLGWLVPYATTDAARDQMASVCETSTTALLGRLNAEGFMGFWPSVADDESADPRDRTYANWLVNSEKVVLSTTLTEPPWDRTRIVNAPAAKVVDDLKAQQGGDILVNNSASVIKALLEADKIDRLALTLLPEILGGGARLLEDGLPASKWSLANSMMGEPGVLCLLYDRTR
jgi:dihydrofolate reductase